MVARAVRATARTFATFRYDSAGAAGPRWYAWSAISTNRASRSASEYTATVGMSISRHVRMIRTAISPRFAIRTRASGMVSRRYDGPRSPEGGGGARGA